MRDFDEVGRNITPCQLCGKPGGAEVRFAPGFDRMVLCPPCDKEEGMRRAAAQERAGWNTTGGVGKVYKHTTPFQEPPVKPKPRRRSASPRRKP